MNFRACLDLTCAGFLLLFTSFHILHSIKLYPKLSIIDISIWMTGITFGLAPFVVIIYGGSLPNFGAGLIIATYFGIFLFILGLMLSKKILYEPDYFTIRENRLIYIIQNFNKIITIKNLILIYIFIWSVRLTYAFVFNISISGTDTTKRILEVPYIFIILNDFSNIMRFTILFWAISYIFSNRRISLLPIILNLSETLYMFFMGRRQMLFVLFLLIFIYISLGYKIKPKRLLPFILLSLLFLLYIFPFFLSLRDVADSHLKDKNKSTINLISQSYQEVISSKLKKSNYKKNVIYRAYIIRWSMQILNQSRIFNGLGGFALGDCILWSVPKFMNPGKYNTLDPEQLINAKFSLPMIDSPSNWPAYGLADFGLVGSFFYGFLLGSILILIYKLAIKLFHRYPIISVTLISSFMFEAFIIEQSPILLFKYLRANIILFIFAFVYKILIYNKSHSVHIKHNSF